MNCIQQSIFPVFLRVFVYNHHYELFDFINSPGKQLLRLKPLKANKCCGSLYVQIINTVLHLIVHACNRV